MKLSAVTISVYYSDQLKQIVENKRHFDRWIIVTVAKDKATQKLCDANGIECHIARQISHAGNEFHKGFNKANLVNEGLDLIGKQGWALLLDADIFLPRLFRLRLFRLRLKHNCLYGLRSRRICNSPYQFNYLKSREPWQDNLEYNTHILGFFQLFSLEQPINRYKSRAARTCTIGKGVKRDDRVFEECFPQERRRFLPMNCLHFLSSGLTQVYHDIDFGSQHKDDEGIPFPWIKTKAQRIAKIGFYPGDCSAGLAARCKRLYLIDFWNLVQKVSDIDLEEDRACLMEVFLNEIEHCDNIEIISKATANDISGAKSIVLDVPPTSQVIREITRLWLPHLRSCGKIMGDYFGFPAWPSTTVAVSNWLGVPDRLSEMSSEWCSNFYATFESKPRTEALSGLNICLHLEAPENVDDLLLSLTSLRQAWKGQLFFRSKRELDADLWLALRRLNVIVTDGFPIFKDREDDFALIVIRELVIVRKSRKEFRKHLDKIVPIIENRNDFTSESESTKGGVAMIYLKGGRAVCIDEFLFKSEANLDDCVCHLLKSPPEGTGVIRSYQSARRYFLRKIAAEVKVSPDVTVLVPVGYLDKERFEEAWIAWKLPANARIIILYNEAPAIDHAIYSGMDSRVQLVKTVWRDQDINSIRAVVYKHVLTRRCAILDVRARPLPGADLLIQSELTSFNLVSLHDGLGWQWPEWGILTVLKVGFLKTAVEELAIAPPDMEAYGIRCLNGERYGWLKCN